MLDSKLLAHYAESEKSEIRKEKDSVILLNDRYNTPSTSLLLFHFEPHAYSSSDLRLKDCALQHISIEGKDIYIFDNFFLEQEGADMRTYSKNATFSRSSYAHQESREKGEEPARSMNNKEKWEFFSKPPQPIAEINKLLGMLAQRLNADISTLPWDICDQHMAASAVATNRHERVSRMSVETGKHEDFNTEKGIPFAIPMLYAKEQTFYPGNFVNGAEGNPWLVSLMLYATEDNFLTHEYGIGTLFCKKDGDIVAKAACQHMRFVIFEGDILHTVEESHIPAEINTWRISYVYKLMLNPRQAGQSLKKAFYELLKSYKEAL